MVAKRVDRSPNRTLTRSDAPYCNTVISYKLDYIYKPSQTANSIQLSGVRGVGVDKPPLLRELAIPIARLSSPLPRTSDHPQHHDSHAPHSAPRIQRAFVSRPGR